MKPTMLVRRQKLQAINCCHYWRAARTLHSSSSLEGAPSKLRLGGDLGCGDAQVNLEMIRAAPLPAREPHNDLPVLRILPD